MRRGGRRVPFGWEEEEEEKDGEMRPENGEHRKC